MQRADVRPILVQVSADDVPAVAVLDGAPNGGRRHAADHQRHPALLGRRGAHAEAVPVDELAPILDVLPGPDRLERLQVFVRAPPAAGERHADGLELLAQPADAQPQHQAPARQVIDRRCPLGEVQRAGLRENVDARAEPQPGRRRGDEGQGDEGVDDRRVRLERQFAVRVVRIDRGVRRGNDDVLRGPDRLVAQRLGVLHEGQDDVRVGELAQVDRNDPEFHGRLSRRSWCRPGAPPR